MGNLCAAQEKIGDFDESFDPMKIMRQIYDSLSLNCDGTSNIYSEMIIAALWVAVLKMYSDWLLEGVYYLRDTCTQGIQIMLNAMEGTINAITGLSFMDFEYLASICIIILLWVGVTKMILNIAKKRPRNMRNTKRYKHSCVTLS